ncbi:MAG: hypothetical protein MN733_38090 [Nitrososphaera sp.]|nr:hypothetical protein [Nitrososphaera sp.]
MQTSSVSQSPSNYLMLVVEFGTLAKAARNLIELAQNVAKEQFTRDSEIEFWSRSWPGMEDQIITSRPDENVTESVSWNYSELEELLRLFEPSTSQRLLKAIQSLRAKTDEMSEYLDKPVSRDSILAAERIASQLPDTLPEGKIGLDEEGDVFLSFHKDDRSAFLTVEPSKLHLLVKGGGEATRYVDDILYNGFVVPNNVLEELSEI